MGAGLFGKLPQKRDFIEVGLERGLVGQLDGWLQGAVAMSREQLGQDWLPAYLSAPIWRFWLGPGIAGRATLGALMPSVDGIGRYFPLILAVQPEATAPPPEFDAQDSWFAAAEEVLLSALADGVAYEAVLAGLGALPSPETGFEPAPDASSVPAMFATLRRMQIDAFYGQITCWWVPAAEGVPPRLMLRRGMPAAVEYAMMIATDRAGQPSAALQGSG